MSPTPKNNAWYLIRKKRATLVSKYPMVIKLTKDVEEKDTSTFIVGIDTGSLYTGVGIVQKCKVKNKPIIKGTIEHRKDVKKLMDDRRCLRRYRRAHKRYRMARFDNRSNSRRKGRVAPSIKQKKESIVRVVRYLNKYINISKYVIEDVAIDIRAIQDGKKLYKWQYQKSNRLDENLRKATILRDGCKCMECRKTNTVLESHHIVPRRLKGSDTLSNLITLCSSCHDKTKGIEEKFIDRYQKMIGGKSFRFDYQQHVMQGKTYLREELQKLGEVELTIGSTTANHRLDWSIEKSHSNDGLVIVGLEISNDDCNIKDWIIKPMRKKSKARTDNVLGFKHRDLVSYTYKNGDTHVGYITGLYPNLSALNFRSRTKECKKVNAKKCKLIWIFNKIYWLDI